MRKLWGENTESSLNNFKIGSNVMPYEIIRAITTIKLCAAKVNVACGKLSKEKSFAIIDSCEKILSGEVDPEQFPLTVWQTGSGTQTNMNVNEVIAGLADMSLHPNDDVNMSQSTNDVFPSAIHIAVNELIINKLEPVIQAIIKTLMKLERDNGEIVKMGRTHYQDATPVKFSDEVSGWRVSLEESLKMINAAMTFTGGLAIGGTAVGTGINAPKGFGDSVTERINKLTKYRYHSLSNKFYGLTSKDAVVFLHGAFKALACNLIKIANDIRLLNSGPRSGLNEITLPANEAGSSIMPGKVNPTQCEALAMVCAEVLGNDTTVGFAASQGSLELNVYMPVIAFKMIESINLLADSILSFDALCISRIKVNAKIMQNYIDRSLMLVTKLSPVIGYDKCAEIVKIALDKDITLKEAAISSGYINTVDYDRYI